MSTYFPYLTFIKYNRFDSFIKCLGGTPNLLNNYMKKYLIGNVRTVSDGVELRVLSKMPPTGNAVQVEATLEDAFLLYFGEKAGDKDDVQI